MSLEWPVLSLGCHVLVFSHEGSGRYKSTLVSYASVTSELARQRFHLPFSQGQGHRAPPNSLLALSGASKQKGFPLGFQIYFICSSKMCGTPVICQALFYNTDGELTL